MSGRKKQTAPTLLPERSSTKIQDTNQEKFLSVFSTLRADACRALHTVAGNGFSGLYGLYRWASAIAGSFDSCSLHCGGSAIACGAGGGSLNGRSPAITGS
jgi:hypothetical protein